MTKFVIPKEMSATPTAEELAFDRKIEVHDMWVSRIKTELENKVDSNISMLFGDYMDVMRDNYTAYERSKSHLYGENAEFVNKNGIGTIKNGFVAERMVLDMKYIRPHYSREPIALRVARFGKILHEIAEARGGDVFITPKDYDEAVRRCDE